MLIRRPHSRVLKLTPKLIFKKCFHKTASGNKLTHLDGETLSRLPRLNSIQLAGSNRWKCDCKLRNLVRRLNDATKEVVISPGTSHIKLVDSPECDVGEGVEESNGNHDEPLKPLIWRNMSK